MSLRRSSPSLTYDLTWAGVRLGVALLPVILFPSWLTWPITVLLVLGVAALVAAAFTYSYVATCPGCGGLIPSLSARLDCVGHQCPHCKRFVEVEGGKLVLTPPDRVDTVPSFAIVLRGSPGELPALCCNCGAPATGTRALVDRKTGLSLDVPHCGGHEPSARLRKTGGLVRLEVGSLRFARALGERDGLDVVGTGPFSEVPKFPWISGAAGILLTGVGVRVVTYEVPAKQLVAGLFVSLGALALMHFVVAAGFLLRRRVVGN